MNTVKDNNFIPAKIGVLCTDGVTLVNVAVSSGGGVAVDGVSVIGFTPGSIDFRNENYRPCWMAQNSVSGAPIPIFVNASGAVLIANS